MPDTDLEALANESTQALQIRPNTPRVPPVRTAPPTQ